LEQPGLAQSQLAGGVLLLKHEELHFDGFFLKVKENFGL
jgi:hypothetical protein